MKTSLGLRLEQNQWLAELCKVLLSANIVLYMTVDTMSFSLQQMHLIVLDYNEFLIKCMRNTL